MSRLVVIELRCELLCGAHGADAADGIIMHDLLAGQSWVDLEQRDDKNKNNNIKI